MKWRERSYQQRWGIIGLMFGVVAFIATPFIMHFALWSLGLPAKSLISSSFSEFDIIDSAIVTFGIAVLLFAAYLSGWLYGAGLDRNLSRIKKGQQKEDEDGSVIAFYVTIISGFLSLGVLVMEGLFDTHVIFHLWNVGNLWTRVSLAVVVICLSFLMMKGSLLKRVTSIVLGCALLLGNIVAVIGSITGLIVAYQYPNKK